MSDEAVRDITVAFGCGLALVLIAALRWLPPDWPRAWRVIASGLAIVTGAITPLLAGHFLAALIPLAIALIAFTLVNSRSVWLQTLTLAAAGGVVWISAFVHLDLGIESPRKQAASETLDMGMKSESFAIDQPILRDAVGATAATDRGKPIKLAVAANDRPDSVLVEPEQATLVELHFADKVLRVEPPSDECNCFGWVFTNGNYYLAQADIESILTDNGYEIVAQPQHNDLVIYRQGGAIAHVGLVSAVDEGQSVLVRSKWGWLGVYVHQVDVSIYGSDFAYFRSSRVGHLLAGLGSNQRSPKPRVLGGE